MPKVRYKIWKPRPNSLAIVETANAIIAEYTLAGFKLTLRQLFYQFVARDLLPNTVKSYNNLGSVINNARLAGLIDWNAIEDRTRHLERVSHWTDPQSILESAADSYAIDLWRYQPYRPEVWIEKDALRGVIEGVCDRNRVPHFSCRGYTSQSEMWDSAQRMIGHIQSGQQPVVLHLGDHDPSGIDMTRDIRERLNLFRAYHVDIRRIGLKRLALNYDQVQQYQPPPNPAKTTDSRFDDYQREYGDDSWELDALEPQVLVDLIQDAIDELVDADKWDEAVGKEQTERQYLKDLAETACDACPVKQVDCLSAPEDSQGDLPDLYDKDR